MPTGQSRDKGDESECNKKDFLQENEPSDYLPLTNIRHITLLPISSYKLIVLKHEQITKQHEPKHEPLNRKAFFCTFVVISKKTP
jgi:hypothetical protein